MWMGAVFHQVSLFSLKPADATATGGRSLLVPTPFGIKMALLDAALRTRGRQAGEEVFALIRDLRVAASPPPVIVVSNCFVRVQKPRRDKGRGDTGDDGNEGGDGIATGPFQRSVGFREYVYYGGPFGIALASESEAGARVVADLAAQITYFGRRGSFFQLASTPRLFEECPRDHRPLDVDSAVPGFLLQLLDDCLRSDESKRPLTFEQADIYSGKPIGTGRVIRQVSVPYKVGRSSKGFATYERIYESAR